MPQTVDLQLSQDNNSQHAGGPHIEGPAPVHKVNYTVIFMSLCWVMIIWRTLGTFFTEGDPIMWLFAVLFQYVPPTLCVLVTQVLYNKHILSFCPLSELTEQLYTLLKARVKFGTSQRTLKTLTLLYYQVALFHILTFWLVTLTRLACYCKTIVQNITCIDILACSL